MLQWDDVWSAAFNDFMQKHGVTEKYLGLDKSVIPALIRYRYRLDDRHEEMAYKYYDAFPTTWAALSVCRLLAKDSGFECQHNCDSCVHAWACFDAKENKDHYMEQVRERYKDMQFYNVSYGFLSADRKDTFENYVFASNYDNVSRILSNHHGEAVYIISQHQIITTLPIPAEEQFVPYSKWDMWA